MDIVNNIQISVNTTQTSNVNASSSKSNENDNSKSFKEVLDESTKSSNANGGNSKIASDSTVSNTNSISQKDDTSNSETKNADNISTDAKNSTKVTAKSQNDNVGVDEKTVEDDDKKVVSVKDVEESMETILAELLQALLVKADSSSNNVKISNEGSKAEEGNVVATDLKVANVNSSIEQALQQLLNSSNSDLKEFAKNMLESFKELKDSNTNTNTNLNTDVLNVTLANNANELLQLLNSDASVNIQELLNGSADTNIQKLLNNNLNTGDGKKVEGLHEQFKNAFDKISKLIEQVTAKGENPQQLVSLKETLQTIKTLLQTVDAKVSSKDSANDQNSTFKQIISEISNKLTKIDEVKANQSDSNFDPNQSNNKSATKNNFLSTDLTKQAEGSKESKDDEVLSKILNNDNDNSKFSNIANRLTEFKPLENLEKLEEPIVNRNTMAQDIVKSVKYMQSNDMRELTVKVNPGTLGEITIKLVAQGDSMKANLQVSSKDTYNLINSQEIKNALNNENIKITEVNISLYNEDTTFYRNESSFGQQLSKGNSGNKDNSNQTNTSLSGEILDEDEAEDTGLSSLNIFV
ncbi:flagellar hook-length control protein FliK [Inconstantimicrobium mannanitabidum]|uniref:Uncharacterized protein n=1 Tax=Inconstantimicrobium mannanitabidum TaxID=1604901 RepID=A0ACB5R950_9CLOT|nr:flagellar hook-length control protein FliK [Clostridium sp. TW13]GKX65491.1 hypothetical protein rsdtw13_07490 [Clostridium sp. TW13]